MTTIVTAMTAAAAAAAGARRRTGTLRRAASSSDASPIVAGASQGKFHSRWVQAPCWKPKVRVAAIAGVVAVATRVRRSISPASSAGASSTRSHGGTSSSSVAKSHCLDRNSPKPNGRPPPTPSAPALSDTWSLSSARPLPLSSHAAVTSAPAADPSTIADRAGDQPLANHVPGPRSDAPAGTGRPPEPETRPENSQSARSASEASAIQDCIAAKAASAPVPIRAQRGGRSVRRCQTTTAAEATSSEKPTPMRP